MPLVRKNVPQSPPALAGTDWQAQLELLQTGTPEERWTAARALGAEPQAAAALGELLQLQSDSRLREVIFTSLAKLNSPASFDAALWHLRGDDAQLRTGALDAMQLMPKMIHQRLPDLLRDHDPDVRILACELARHMAAADAANLLAEILVTDPEKNVCAAAIDVLADIGGEAELPAMEACGRRFAEEFFLHFSIKAASGNIRSRAGT